MNVTVTLGNGEVFNARLHGLTMEGGKVVLDLDMGDNTTRVVPVDFIVQAETDW